MSVWLVVGLGNPGKEYAATRHNVGYLVVDELASRFGVGLKKHGRAHADTADARLGDERVVLLRSRSYMNESGGPVKAAADYANRPLHQRVKERIALALMRFALFLTGKRY